MGSEIVTTLNAAETLKVFLSNEQLDITLENFQAWIGAGLPVVGGTVDGAVIGGNTPCAAQVYKPINAQTGTTYTLALSDNGKLVTCSNSGSITVTIPTNASVAFPVGAEIDVAQLGAGGVTIAGASGVTLVSLSSYVLLSGQYAEVKLKKTATNTWLLTGSLQS